MDRSSRLLHPAGGREVDESDGSEESTGSGSCLIGTLPRCPGAPLQHLLLLTMSRHILLGEAGYCTINYGVP